ncbi:MAG: hypothetical protein ACPIOQ_72505, partial [Promethearchaeia archaeon]
CACGGSDSGRGPCVLGAGVGAAAGRRCAGSGRRFLSQAQIVRDYMEVCVHVKFCPSACICMCVYLCA